MSYNQQQQQDQPTPPAQDVNTPISVDQAVNPTVQPATQTAEDSYQSQSFDQPAAVPAQPSDNSHIETDERPPNPTESMPPNGGDQVSSIQNNSQAMANRQTDHESMEHAQMTDTTQANIDEKIGHIDSVHHNQSLMEDTQFQSAEKKGIPSQYEHLPHGFDQSSMDTKNMMGEQSNDIQMSTDNFLYDVEIAKKVEQEKLTQIYFAAQNLKQKLTRGQGRCSRCTLMPPCKHYPAPDHDINAQEEQIDSMDKSPGKRSKVRSTDQSKQDIIKSPQSSKQDKSLSPEQQQRHESEFPNQQDSLFDNQPNQSISARQPIKNNQSFVKGKNSLDGTSMEDRPQKSVGGIPHTHHQSKWSATNSFAPESYGVRLKDNNMVIRDPLQESSITHSPIKNYQFDHHQKMTEMAGGNHGIHVNESVSPYSILRNSGEDEVDETIQKITLGVGPRGNRAQLLRQLALKKKIERNPFLAKTNRMSRDQAFFKGEDPHTNTMGMNYVSLNSQIYPNGQLPHEAQSQKRLQVKMMGQTMDFNNFKGRMRNQRGEYQSMDPTQAVNTHRTIPSLGMPSVGVSARGSSTADYATSTRRRRGPEQYKTAENRLRMIEQISKYREQKIKKEFEKLEEELKMEDDKQRKHQMKEYRMQEYHRKQKEKLADYQKIKQMREMEKVEIQQRDYEQLMMKQRIRMEKNEEMKSKIRMYKEYKARFIMEIQMREQGIIAKSQRRNKKKGGAQQLVPLNHHINVQPHFDNQELEDANRQTNMIEQSEFPINQATFAETQVAPQNDSGAGQVNPSPNQHEGGAVEQMQKEVTFDKTTISNAPIESSAAADSQNNGALKSREQLDVVKENKLEQNATTFDGGQKMQQEPSPGGGPDQKAQD